MAAIRTIFLAAVLGSTSIAASAAAQAEKPVAAVQAASAARQLAAIAERYYDEKARMEPLNATFFGDNRFDHLLPMTLVPAQRARMFAFLHDTREALMGVDRSKLDGTDVTSFDLLVYEINDALRFEPWRDHLMPMNHMDAVPVVVANFGGGQGSQPIKTVAEYEAYLARVAALPEWIDAAISNMRVGMQEKLVLPRALVVSLLPQIKTLAAATLEKSDYYTPIHNMPAGVDVGEKARLKGAYGQAIAGKVLPALGRLARFLENEYLPAARDSAGWGGLPNGAQWYRAWVASNTTTAMSPDEIHRIGLDEMARINAEFKKVGRRIGYVGKPQLLTSWMLAQERYRPFKSEEQVLQAYRDINARVVPKLPQLFATLPKAPLEIRPEPPLSRATASDHYTLPAVDGSRPGIFWAVINDPTRYGSTLMTSLFLHEGHPGHHFQLAKQQDLPLPRFRKNGGHNAYVEGWALYAETLGREMGLYDDANAYAGHLMLDMRRAARLVVDTGLHAKGWTREQTITFLMEQAGDSEADARNATERYMAWPAQALGYKVGAMKIMALRQQAAAALGPQFNLARFHDAVLAEGSLPLGMLEAKMHAWIAEQGR
ncbi:DUF885 domain-containing protein [Massilia sp. PAMC28688]|uniref:DUF885 domain-containing protein n=1 Tax=Massilia sp. PAMC28688 TaxID=2861283 RepID=UPI001C634D4D|nr:DUF885 domain-containing protein [Massilia sp. PAMC28688]QYF92289.1 DUF885 domain-containing protein [Massilia sp. PAMC28688]